MLYGLTALISFGGSFIQSSCGFGFAIVFMALCPMFMPFRTASILEAIAAFFMVVYIAVKLRRHLDFKLLLPTTVAGVLCSWLGVNAMMQLSDKTLHRILGGTLLALVAYFVFFSGRVRLKPTLRNGVIAGMVSGFGGGLFNIGGPPMVAYFLSVTDDKEKYSANLQAFFCTNTLVVFLLHLLKGSVSSDMLPAALCALAGTAAGTFLGFVLFKRLSMRHIKKFVYLFMLIAGGYLLIFP